MLARHLATVGYGKPAADVALAGRYAYLSLGTKEKRGMRERLKSVEDATRRTEALLRARGASTDLVLTSGVHFDHVEERIAAGMAALFAWLCR